MMSMGILGVIGLYYIISGRRKYDIIIRHKPFSRIKVQYLSVFLTEYLPYNRHRLNLSETVCCMSGR